MSSATAPLTSSFRPPFNSAWETYPPCASAFTDPSHSAVNLPPGINGVGGFPAGTYSHTFDAIHASAAFTATLVQVTTRPDPSDVADAGVAESCAKPEAHAATQPAATASRQARFQSNPNESCISIGSRIFRLRRRILMSLTKHDKACPEQNQKQFPNISTNIPHFPSRRSFVPSCEKYHAKIFGMSGREQKETDASSKGD